MYSKIAPMYFQRNINVVPIAPGTKACLVTGWKDVNFQEVYNVYPDHGIGLDLSSVDLVVLDIDVLEKDKQEKIEELLKDYPTPIMRKGNPNKLPSRFYAKTWQTTKMKLPGIDLLCAEENQMVQVLIPPTYHPSFTNTQFEWVGNYDLLNFDISMLPPMPEILWEKLSEIVSDKKEHIKTVVTLSDGSRCNHGSHNQLSAMCIASITSGESIDETVNTLLSYDESINPKVSYFLCPSRKEWRVKDRRVNAYQFVLDATKNQLKKGVIQSTAIKNELTIDFTPSVAKRKEFKKLPRLEGLGQIIFNDLYQNSPIPRSQLCFMNTINIISLLINNNLYLRGTAANLYQYGVAPSGYGKDFSFKRAKQMLTDANMSHLIGSSSPTSETVVLKLLETQRAQCMFVNEAESLLKRITNDRTNMGLRECLTDLYDYGGRMHTPKFTMTSGNKGTKTEATGGVFSPFVNILMTSTTEAFNKYAGLNLFETGFGSRFLFFFEDRFKTQKFIEDYNPPIDSKIIKALVLFSKHKTDTIIDVTPSNAPFKIKKAIISKEGEDEYRKIFDEIEKDKLLKTDSQFFGLLSRKLYFVNKLTLIHHAMINPADYCDVPVSAESHRWAKEAIDSIMHNMMANLNEEIATTPYGEMVRDVIRFIKKRAIKKKETTVREIDQRFRSLTKKQRRDVLSDLENSGDISIQEGSKIVFKGK